jgi:two-component sensor histidine kinase
MTLAAASRVTGPRAAGHDDARMTPGAQISLELALRPTPQTPRIARRRLAERFAAQLGDDELQDAKLLTSELVTNAVLHGRGQIELTARLDENRLTVDVADEGHGFEPAGLERPFDAVGGHGLNIVDTIASRWGIQAGSSHVWFELDRRGPRLRPTN